MTTPDHAAIVNLLYVVADTDAFYTVHDAASLDAFDECESRAIVCDRQSQGILRLLYIDNLRLASDVSEDEVFEADLATE